MVLKRGTTAEKSRPPVPVLNPVQHGWSRVGSSPRKQKDWSGQAPAASGAVVQTVGSEASGFICAGQPQKPSTSPTLTSAMAIRSIVPAEHLSSRSLPSRPAFSWASPQMVLPSPRLPIEVSARALVDVKEPIASLRLPAAV